MNFDSTLVKVDLDAISANFDAIRAKAGVPVMAIIKADAYGHGAIQIARLLQDRCAFFGVSSILEAMELRKAGLTIPILILGNTPVSAFPAAIEEGIRPAIYRYEDALGTYLVKLSGMNLSVPDNRTLNTLLYTVSDVERIADHAVAVAKAALEMEEKQINFSAQAKAELEVLERAVTDVIDRTTAAYENFDRDLAMKVEPQEQVVDTLVREVKSRHVRRLRDGVCSVEYGFVLDDLLTAYERTADHCSNIAVEMLQVSEGKLEAHEYLNALKAGELHESAAFSERFARYKAHYAFPEEE